ncbi:MAG TPA: sulfotransferase [Gammaproteobacteria bacterium]|nr:sulfotransferase [Xanthomonadales bacterium]MCB1595295.1 sulfotransferase [Xanthomonadales bacterium]HOP21309.1 sulfotransferase [Gammaproteobacteria bacterium]HPI94889.1 sulfotransferase [Gammaproteobacteria bacterium]HPQ86482.1 sulfotransferase [Gammaproteobacteria bacterium]
MNNNSVFFILGSVRSGTTLLRDLLKKRSNLLCPEETHFFRWAEPFESTDYNYVNKTAETLVMHRKMDGVNENEFLEILESSKDRKELTLNYMSLFRKAHNNFTGTIFDKTPQNVYGLPLIKSYFPDSKIVHIIRNPLNVISSLKRGRGLLPQNLTGAINFWKEAILIINTMKPILGESLYELKYEDLTNNPDIEINKLLDFLGEEKFENINMATNVHASEDSYLSVLDNNEVEIVKAELSNLMKIYGYQ